MAVNNLGSVPASTTIYLFWTSHDGATGANEALTGLAATDIEIYKNGGTTQRASDAGYTLLDTDGIDFDGMTGVNGVSIDLSDNTDSGFYAVGSSYDVFINAVTIDAQTVIIHLASFRIVAAEAITGKPKVDVDGWLGTAAATPTTAGVPEVDLTHVAGSAVSTSSAQLGVNVVNAAGTAWGSGAITAASIASDAITAAKLAADVATEINTAVLAVLGALDDTAADGDPTTTDTALAYLKQLINILIGSAGVVTFPSSATPGNAVSLAEVLRQVYDEVAGLNGGALLDAAGIRTAVGLASANLDTQLDALPTAAENADAVWDEAATGHTDAGKAGEQLWTDVDAILVDTGTDGVVVAAASKTGYRLSSTGIQDIWDALTSALSTASSIGKLLVDNINATISSRASQTSVDDLPTNTELSTALGTADDATLAAIAALNNLSAAQVNAEVDTALADYDPPTKTELDTAQAAIIDGILDGIRIRKNTEFAAFPFKMVDETDHVTAETGLTVTATRSIDGAAFGACANSAAEIASGWYKITLAAADLNGDVIILRFTATGADDREIVVFTQPTD